LGSYVLIFLPYWDLNGEGIDENYIISLLKRENLLPLCVGTFAPEFHTNMSPETNKMLANEIICKL
jgi:hypothetical protein